MKEKLKEYKNVLIFAGGAMLASAAAIIAGYYGYKVGNDDGFQRGCDMLFCAMVKEFPDRDYSEFLTKYRK